jgi:hypothetical protein
LLDVKDGEAKVPAPHVPGKTEFERFDSALRQVLSVSKEELLKREAREKTKNNRNYPALSASITHFVSIVPESAYSFTLTRLSNLIRYG